MRLPYRNKKVTLWVLFGIIVITMFLFKFTELRPTCLFKVDAANELSSQMVRVEVCTPKSNTICLPHTQPAYPSSHSHIIPSFPFRNKKKKIGKAHIVTPPRNIYFLCFKLRRKNVRMWIIRITKYEIFKLNQMVKGLIYLGRQAAISSLQILGLPDLIIYFWFRNQWDAEQDADSRTLLNRDDDFKFEQMNGTLSFERELLLLVYPNIFI